jgi:hypothetical protein
MECGSKGNHHKAKDIIIIMKCLFGHFIFEKKKLGKILFCQVARGSRAT